MSPIIDADELDDYRWRCQHILDARSPAEFAHDHLPGAHNTPVLDNLQRHEIGSQYRQDAFNARKAGAVNALQNIASILQMNFIQVADRGTHFLVYCARGGQRSSSLAYVLQQIGFRVSRLKHGYRTYRAYVANQLARPLPQPIYVLHGYTGSRKTLLLNNLASSINVIDLEGCAHHRGSLLGDLPEDDQPSQKAFETALTESIRRMVPGKPTLVEGESRKIGRCTLPQPIWKTMMSEAQHLWLDMPREQRIANILEDYDELKSSKFLAPKLEKIAEYLTISQRQTLLEALNRQAWSELVNLLLEHHYDPLYERHRRHHQGLEIKVADFRHAEKALAAHLFQK